MRISPRNSIRNSLTFESELILKVMEKQPKILLVEDDQVGQAIIVRLFKRLGLIIDVASNGKEAISKIMNEDFDLVLMDVSMPEMDGISTTKYIREQMQAPKKDVKIVAMSGYDSEADIKRFKAAGMNDYIGKPVILVDFFKKMNLIPKKPIPFQGHYTEPALSF